MILKASQRGGAKQLAIHLMRTDDNEHVEVHEVRGFVSEDLPGALNEASAVSRGTRCKQFLFSVSLNPPETERVEIETFENALERIESKTGLGGQPRVVVFHEKEGRRHAHCVWSRIDAETMTARNLPHFKLKLRGISKELYLENDWTMPRGLMDSAARDPRNYTLAEYQQAKRMGRDARNLKAELQECWAVSDSKAAFEQALRERGLTLAKGDRRGHVAVTHDGEVLSVARYVGKRAKEVRAKLGEPDTFQSVDSAKAAAARDMDSALTRHMHEARVRQTEAMVPLEQRRCAMTDQHRAERGKLEDGQKRRWAIETRARAERFSAGLKGVWRKLTGQHARIQRQNEQEAFTALQRDREQRQGLIDAQLAERQRLQVEIREARARHTTLLAQLHKDRQRYQPEDREPPLPVGERPRQDDRRDAGSQAQTVPPPERPPPFQQIPGRLSTVSAEDRLQKLERGTLRHAVGQAFTPTDESPKAIPSMEERLKWLENDEPRPAPAHDHEPEPER